MAIVGVWMLAHELQVVALPGLPLGPVRYVHLVLLGLTAGVCLWRAVAYRAERAAWLCFGLAVLSWTAGETYFAIVLWDATEIPVPSPADVGYLAMYPFLFAGIVLLLRDRCSGIGRTIVVDGVTAALAVAAASAAIVFRAVFDTVGGKALAVGTNLAYPAGDLVLLGLVFAAFALNGWRLDRTWAALGTGLAAFWIADSYFLVQQAHGSYVPGGSLDIGWWASMPLIAWAGLQAAPPRARAGRDQVRTIVAPISFALLGLGLLLVAAVHPLNLLAVCLAACSLLTVIVRMVMTFRENLTMLRASRREALLDALTGLGNRRALLAELAARIPAATNDAPLTLVLFDLDGFKHYNDTFGHPAGDALLERLARRLAAVLGARGHAFRMGGDEFCALLAGPAGAAIVERAAAALAENGEGFSISSSHGAVEVPREASDPHEALLIADQRMYAQKHGGRGSALRQSRDVLVRVVAETDAPLGEHLSDVAGLARELADAFGLGADEIERIGQAAESHDIGKVAVPDAILTKQSALDEHEWDLIHRHTLIGQRIVSAAPALARAGDLVRSHHERWDGAGYPDGLAGERIPLGSRIIAVCDAYSAMTVRRPNRPAMSPAQAIAELRRTAGSQFDPAVVEVFCAQRVRAPAERSAA